jgi:hypothetical protein
MESRPLPDAGGQVGLHRAVAFGGGERVGQADNLADRHRGRDEVPDMLGALGPVAVQDRVVDAAACALARRAVQP